MAVSQLKVEAIVLAYESAQLRIKMIFLQIELLLTANAYWSRSVTTVAAQKM